MLFPRSWLLVLLVVVLAGSGGVYVLGRRDGRAGEQRKAYVLERRARIASIRIADLTKDRTARELREASRVADSAAAAQRAKRKGFTITSDTTIIVVGDSLPQLAPAPLIAYVRGEDAKLSVDSTWRAKVAADTMAIAEQRDQWKRRALSAEAQLERERHRLGLKTGIAVGVGTTLLIARAIQGVLR